MMKEKLAIILLGAPGSGKGTQGKLLSKRAGIRIYTMSSMITQELDKGEKEWTKHYAEDMKKGILLGDEEVCQVFEEGFEFEDKVILDGMPRTDFQVKWLKKFLGESGYDIRVLYLDCNESKLLDRILLRAKAEGRADDNEEVYRRRLDFFDKRKEIILRDFEGSVHKINGDGTVDEVEELVKQDLKM